MRRSRPSRSSAAAAGWGCRQLGTFRDLLPGHTRRLYWLNPIPLIRSRNDRLVKLFGDPTDDMRREWVARQARLGQSPDKIIDRYAGRDRISFVLLGDPGEGDESQYVVVPVLAEVGEGTDFAVVCSDVIYPAGGIRTYATNFYAPYRDYPAPIYGLPGNHDWYDGLTGFMTTFCDASLLDPPPALPATGPRFRRTLRRLLWHRPPAASIRQLAEMRWLRDLDSQQAGQPGPYCAIEAGPVLLVLIDTGILGGIDRDQGEWLRRISAASPKPKILLTGRPIYTYGHLQSCPIEGGGDVNEIVTDPAHNYIAVIGGDDHNYQRYPIRLRDGRTLQYIVSGGSGAYLSATHQIPNVDCLAPAVTEEDFRCYPLRGDSLAHFSRRYDKILGFGFRGLTILPDDAVRLMAERVGITPPRACTPAAAVGAKARRAADVVFPLPAQGSSPQAHNFYSLFFDSDTPPMFKSFLRLDASDREVVIDCYAATGCREHELAPVLEDRVRARQGPDGRWCWTSETPERP